MAKQQVRHLKTKSIDPGTTSWKALDFESTCLLWQRIQHRLPIQSHGKKWTHKRWCSEYGSWHWCDFTWMQFQHTCSLNGGEKKWRKCTWEPQKQFGGC